MHVPPQVGLAAEVVVAAGALADVARHVAGAHVVEEGVGVEEADVAELAARVLSHEVRLWTPGWLAGIGIAQTPLRKRSSQCMPATMDMQTATSVCAQAFQWMSEPLCIRVMKYKLLTSQSVLHIFKAKKPVPLIQQNMSYSSNTPHGLHSCGVAARNRRSGPSGHTLCR
jgi:hypothetical protein